MTSNQNLIQKADLALADLASNGGLLLPEQTDRFIQVLIDSPTIVNRMRTVTMSGPQKKINKINFGSRVLRKATSATPLSAGERVKPDLGQVSLSTQEVIAEIHLPYDVIEDNIEGGNIGVAANQSPGGLHSTLVDLLAARAALDLEELVINGDTSSGDNYLALFNGVLKQATDHVVSHGGATINKDAFKLAVKAMPDKYLRNRSDLEFFISVDNETEYRDTIANRVTGLGDAALVSASSLAVFGSSIIPAALMPQNKGIYTNPNNLILGVQRKLNLEFDKDISARKFIVVLTMRIDFVIEEKDAIVVIEQIG